MKQSLFIAVILILVSTSCKKDTQDLQSGTQQTPNTTPSFNALFRYAGEDYSQAVTIPFANNLIQSYLTSIKYPSNDSTLRSMTFDADSLRNYLNDTTHGKIVTLKFIFAHQPSYVQNNYGRQANFNGRVMTMIVVGMDEDDRYIYNRNNMVYEHFYPCPATCSNSEATLTNPQ
jgi:hypothetical protein